MVPDYQLEDAKQQAAMERQQREPKERCFKCGKEIEPQELIEYYDLAFCGQSCLDQAMQCPECGEPAEDVGGYCAGCAEKNRIYTMSDAEFWGMVNNLADRYSMLGWFVNKWFWHYDNEIRLAWTCCAKETLEELAKLFEARGIKYRTEMRAQYGEYSRQEFTISVYLTGGKYREA